MSLPWVVFWCIWGVCWCQQCAGTEEGFSAVSTSCNVGSTNLNTWFTSDGTVISSQQAVMLTTLRARGNDCFCAVEAWYKLFESCASATKADDPNYQIADAMRVAGACVECTKLVEEEQFTTCVPSSCFDRMKDFVESDKSELLSRSEAQGLCACYSHLITCWRQKICFTGDSCHDNIEAVMQSFQAIDYSCDLPTACGPDDEVSTPSTQEAASEAEATEATESPATPATEAPSESEPSAPAAQQEEDSDAVTPSTEESSSGGIESWVIALIVIGIVLAVLLLVAVVLMNIKKKRRNQPNRRVPKEYTNYNSAPPPVYEYPQYGAGAAPINTAMTTF